MVDMGGVVRVGVPAFLTRIFQQSNLSLTLRIDKRPFLINYLMEMCHL